MNNIPVIIAVVVVLLGLGFFLMKPNNLPVQTPTGSITPTESVVTPTPSASSEPTAEKTFQVNGKNFSFDVKQIKVKLNDAVKITFTNTEGNHDLAIDEFGVTTKIVGAGESESVQFIANKAGTFEYYCSVGQHRAMGMVGKLIVE